MIATSANVTIRWNTNAPARPTPAPLAAGTVLAVRKTMVYVRMPNGTIRSYTANAREAGRLRALIGHSISFRVIP